MNEIATHLVVNPDTIYHWVTRKSMPELKVRKLWKFMVSEVDDWVRTGKAGKKDLRG